MRSEKGVLGLPLNIEKGRVEMIHGSGGRASSQLFEEIILPAFDNPWLRKAGDQAVVEMTQGRWALSTDSFVVSPIFFPGGDIGSLAVHGTVNDLAMGGAQPRYLTVGLVIEEGFPLSDLARITQSLGSAAERCGVSVVAGDTKVVERGKGDGIFINTSGIGWIPRDIILDPSAIRVGDILILSGSIGEHGAAVLAAREGGGLVTSLLSDSAPLHDAVQKLIASGPGLVCLRDPTRGGVATVLNEWARETGLVFEIEESRIPIRQEVRGISEILGIDPLYLANEGRFLAVCRPESADRLLSVLKSHPLGLAASQIGHVKAGDPKRPGGMVRMTTLMGGVRLVDWLLGDPLPRIC